MLHTKFKLALVGLTCAMFAGCGSSGDSIEDCIEYLPVQQRDGKSWSFVDKKGNIVAEDEFKNHPTAVINGMFSVQEGETYSLYNIKDLKKEVLSDLVSVGTYNEDVIPVTQKNERITLVDKKGKVKATLEPVDGKEITACANFVWDGMLTIVNEEGKYGFADALGKVKIKPQYEYAYGFYDGVALVAKKVNDDETVTCAIDKSGKELFKVKDGYEPKSEGFKDGLLPAYDNNKEAWGFLNKKGEFKKLSNKVQKIGAFNSDFFAYRSSDDEWGVMNMDSETIVKAKYDAVAILDNGKFFVSKEVDGKDRTNCYILDKKGEKEFEFDEYKEVYPIDNGHFDFLARTGKKYVLVNDKGEQIGDNEFAEVRPSFAQEFRVTSDYFNPESVVEALTSELKDGGFGRYTVGMSATALGIKDYDSYVWETRYLDEDLNKQGWRFTTSFALITDESIARRDGEYDAFYNWVSRVIPNSDAKVETIRIEAECQKPCWKEIKESLISAIKAKGYTMKENLDDMVAFSGKDCTLVISSSYEGRDITLAVGKVAPETAMTEVTDWGEEAPATELVEDADWDV